MLYTAGHITQLPWGHRAERYGEGKRLRKKVPRERHADLLGIEVDADPADRDQLKVGSTDGSGRIRHARSRT